MGHCSIFKVGRIWTRERSESGSWGDSAGRAMADPDLETGLSSKTEALLVLPWEGSWLGTLVVPWHSHSTWLVPSGPDPCAHLGHPKLTWLLRVFAVGMVQAMWGRGDIAVCLLPSPGSLAWLPHGSLTSLSTLLSHPPLSTLDALSHSLLFSLLPTKALSALLECNLALLPAPPPGTSKT